MALLTGAEIVLRVLESQGVDQIFGIPGGMMLPLYDKLNFSSIKHHLTRHEQGATHMAEGYARTTGKVGVVFVTSGPGATNTVTGLYDAKLDSTPMLVISAQVVRSVIATDGFQEADVVGITMAATKHNELIDRVDAIEEAVKRALFLAKDGRPGPVLLDIPKDVLVETCEYPRFSTDRPVFYKRVVSGDFEDAARALCTAKKPVCYFGGGVINADASEELIQLIYALNIPATGTLMGLGALSGEDSHHLGMLGMHGTFAANKAMHESDLVLAAGVRFDDRVTGKVSEFCPYAKIIHIDIDPSEINKIKKANWPLIGDAKPILSKLLQECQKFMAEGYDGRDIALNQWWDTIRRWQIESPLTYIPDPQKIKPQDVVRAVYQQSKGDIIAVTDVGQHQMWTAQYFPIQKPRHWVTSGGLGTMGFGLPAAIGAKFGCLDKTVVAFVGDGSFQMTLQELSSMMVENIDVKVVIFNNHFLGMVRQWQDLFFDQRFMATNLQDLSPDFVKIADAYQILAVRVSSKADLDTEIAKMLAHKGPYLLDVIVDETEHVYPMVPAGSAAKDMILGKGE